MPALPKPTAPTVRAIYDAYAAMNKQHDSFGISVGEAGTECDRALWFAFRWCSERKANHGRTVSIFRTGDYWEDRFVDDLRGIGVDVSGQQDKIRLAAGHVRGKCDGKALGVIEAPKTEHLLEFKSSNDKNFKKIVREGCAKAAPKHYAQCQLGMHAFGLTRCLYLVVNKNDDERYAERIKYDAEYCMRLLARLERIIQADRPPTRLCIARDDWRANTCPHAAVCWMETQSRSTCRSCLHSTPEMDGDAHWSCARFSKPLSFDEQKACCPAHLFIPDLVDGEQIDFDEEKETVTYRMQDGSVWVDGE